MYGIVYEKNTIVLNGETMLVSEVNEKYKEVKELNTGLKQLAPSKENIMKIEEEKAAFRQTPLF